MLYRLILHIIKIGISFNVSPHTSQSFEELESENVISLHTSDTMLFLTHISENKLALIPIIGVLIVLAPSHHKHVNRWVSSFTKKLQAPKVSVTYVRLYGIAHGKFHRKCYPRVEKWNSNNSIFFFWKVTKKGHILMTKPK